MKGDGPAIKALPPMPDWELSACRSHPDPELWSSARATHRRIAIKTCATCPVREACAQWSLSLPASDQSTWGGMTTQERKDLRAQRNRLAAAAAAAPAGGARVNAAKDKCDHGHKLSGSNLVMVRDPRDGRSYRQCRECRKIRRRVSASLRRQRDSEAINAARRARYAARKAAAAAVA